MELVLEIEKSFINDISNCEEELQLFLNMNMENKEKKKKKIKKLLETIILKEQALNKWLKITKGIKK